MGWQWHQYCAAKYLVNGVPPQHCLCLFVCSSYLRHFLPGPAVWLSLYFLPLLYFSPLLAIVHSKKVTIPHHSLDCGSAATTYLPRRALELQWKNVATFNWDGTSENFRGLALSRSSIPFLSPGKNQGQLVIPKLVPITHLLTLFFLHRSE